MATWDLKWWQINPISIMQELIQNAVEDFGTLQKLNKIKAETEKIMNDAEKELEKAPTPIVKEQIIQAAMEKVNANIDDAKRIVDASNPFSGNDSGGSGILSGFFGGGSANNAASGGGNGLLSVVILLIGGLAGLLIIKKILD